MNTVDYFGDDRHIVRSDSTTFFKNDPLGPQAPVRPAILAQQPLKGRKAEAILAALEAARVRIQR